MIKNTSQCGYLGTIGFYRVCTRQRYALCTLRPTLRTKLRATFRSTLRPTLRFTLRPRLHHIYYALSCTTSWVGDRQRRVKEAGALSPADALKA